MRQTARSAAVIAVGVLGSLVAAPAPAEALTCAITEGAAEALIRDGWPPAAPYEYALIVTVIEITPERGDSGSYGEVLRVRTDAVLRGDAPLSTVEIFNPPLGIAGWPDFAPGHQYFIGANPPSESTGGRIQTFLCAPNEEITTRARFAELLSYSAHPMLPSTAVSPPSRGEWLGVILVLASLIGVGWRARRSIGA
jgi:hypothetical protein